VAVYAEGWVGYQDYSRSRVTTGTLREAYLDIDLGPVQVRAGRQIVVWGRADGINPTDNVSPRDYTLLVPDDDDQRFGTPIVKTSWYVGTASLTGIWAPGFEPDVVPTPPPPPPLTVIEERPVGRESLAQGALRLERSGAAVDWSLSYFDAFDRLPNIGLRTAADGTSQIVLRHPRVQVVGADLALPMGRFGVRAEGAYTVTRDRRGDDPEIANPFLHAVVGVDRTFSEYVNVNLQYSLRVVTRFHDPLEIADPAERDIAIQEALVANQLDRVQHGATLRVGDKFLNEALEAGLSGAVYGPTLNYVARAKLSYAVTDRWRITAGFDWFDGHDPSPFHLLRKNSGGYLEIRLGL
jgi:hypothetical protein